MNTTRNQATAVFRDVAAPLTKNNRVGLICGQA